MSQGSKKTAGSGVKVIWQKTWTRVNILASNFLLWICFYFLAFLLSKGVRLSLKDTIISSQFFAEIIDKVQVGLGIGLVICWVVHSLLEIINEIKRAFKDC